MDSQNDGVMVKWSHGATRLRAVRTIKRWHNYAFVHGSMCIYVGPITGRSASVDACHILLANISSIFRFFPVGTAHFFHVRPGKHANDIELSFILWQLSFFAQYQH